MLLDFPTERLAFIQNLANERANTVLFLLKAIPMHFIFHVEEKNGSGKVLSI
jgi:hypothetical protein